MLFLLRRKSERLVSGVIERRNQSIRRRENFVQFHTATMEKPEVDSEYATTDNEEHIQEQSNQINRTLIAENQLATKVGGVRQREPLMDGPHQKLWDV